MAGSHPDPIPGPTGVGQPVVAARSNVTSVVVEQLRIGKRTDKGKGVRVRIATDKEEARPPVTLPFEPVRLQRVPVGHMVESALPVCEADGMAIVPIMDVTEDPADAPERNHTCAASKTHEYQQTVPLRRQCAEAERLPVKGKLLTEARIATNIEDNQR